MQEDFRPTKDDRGEHRNLDSHVAVPNGHDGGQLPVARTEHLGSTRQYWRDIILGVNDGLVSTFLLVAGVAGGGMSSRDILLTAIAGSIAGAVSMSAGEFVATKSQNEVMEGEIALEKTHIARNLDEETSELEGLLDLIGMSRDKALRQSITDYYVSHPDDLLQIMVALEFGVLGKEWRSPLRAALVSGCLFVGGALPSIIPFIFSGDSPKMGLIIAAFLTIFVLMIVGAVKTWATRTKCVTAAVENLAIAGFGGGFAYGVGVLFDTVISA